MALNQITRNALDRQQAKRLAKAAALQSQRQEEMKKAAALETMNLSAVGESVAIGEAGFVHLDTIPSGQRICAMCKRGYPVQHGDDGDASLGHYPVQLSCHHLVCFGCAKVMLRMHVNCTCCGGTFGDGKSELAKIEEQIQLCRQWLRDVIAVKSVGVGGKFTQEDLDAALTLLSIAGKDISMEDIHAGLALLDLQAGTDTTLEEYLLTISP